jgi:hypothetical protein
MGTKEYHAQKSREWYQRQPPEVLKKRRVYAADRRKQAKDFWVKEFGSVCAHCKQSFPNCVFEFHHIDHSEKDLQPSHMLHLRKEIQERELKKCIMLCANCHRIEHDKL